MPRNIYTTRSIDSFHAARENQTVVKIPPDVLNKKKKIKKY